VSLVAGIQKKYRMGGGEERSAGPLGGGGGIGLDWEARHRRLGGVAKKGVGVGRSGVCWEGDGAVEGRVVPAAGGQGGGGRGS